MSSGPLPTVFWVHGVAIFFGDLRTRGPDRRPTVSESGSVARPVLGLRSRAQGCRRRQFASSEIRTAHAGGFNIRACLCMCSYA